MCVYIYVCIYMCICVYVCVYMYVYMCVCKYVCVYICMCMYITCACVCLNLHVCVCVSMSVYAYVYMCICVYVGIYTCIYIYIYIKINMYAQANKYDLLNHITSKLTTLRSNPNAIYICIVIMYMKRHGYPSQHRFIVSVHTLFSNIDPNFHFSQCFVPIFTDALILMSTTSTSHPHHIIHLLLDNKNKTYY